MNPYLPLLAATCAVLTVIAGTATILTARVLRRQASRLNVLTAENQALRAEIRALRTNARSLSCNLDRAVAFLNTYRAWTGQHLGNIWPDIDHLTSGDGGDPR